jgi:hypothetical protein
MSGFFILGINAMPHNLNYLNKGFVQAKSFCRAQLNPAVLQPGLPDFS